MAKYLVLYRASASAQEQMGDTTPEQAQAGMELIGGFSILEADSQEALTKLLDDHPHFHMAGDAAIEVLEFQAIPGM